MITPFDLPLVGSPIMLAVCGVLLIVLRAGASRVFFDIVGTFQSQKLLSDAGAAMTTLNALVVDGLSGMEESGAMVAEQMEQIVDATVPLAYEIEKATLEFEKFIDTERDATGAIADSVKNVGLQFGFTATESLNAGARMAQLSTIIGQTAVPAATEMALAFGLIGDMTPETAMQKLINIQQQTNFLFKETTKEAYNAMTADQKRLHIREEMGRVLNQLNSVEDHSAATMSKITGVMNEFASQAALTGESMGMMAAMSATLIEAGEEQGKGGRALRMIYARLGADTSGAASVLEEMGVATKNADGSLRSLSSVMSDLQPIWNNLNSGQKQALAQQVAGNRHYVRFLKLAENFDRVIDLNNEAQGETARVYNESGEAVGFLNDMMTSQAVLLDQARNKLELVNAQFGDMLVPALIDATNFQVEFNNQLFQMVNHLQGTNEVLQGFFEFQQIMSTTFAPFFSAMINVKAMNVALSTQRQIMRALNGEQLARVTKSKADEHAEIQRKKIIASQIAYLTDLTREQRQEEFERSTAALLAAEKEHAELDQKKIALEMINFELQQTGEYEGENVRIKTAAAAYRKAIDAEELQAQKNINQAERLGVEIKEIAAVSTRALGRRTIETRQAKEHLADVIREEILALEGEQNALKQSTMAHRINVEVMEDGTKIIHIQTFAQNLHTEATERQTFAVMRLSMAMMKLGGILMVGEMLIMMFKDSLFFIKDETHAARIAMIMMTAGMMLMTAEMAISMGATLRLAGAKGSLTLADVAATISTKGLTTAMWQYVASASAAVFSTATLYSLLTWGAFIVVAAGIVLALDAIIPKFDEFSESSLDLADATEDVSTSAADMAAEMNYAFDSVDYSFLTEGTEQMEDFNNAREEMFFGFKAGQVTGDLIKQVQQGGVENFVANTEIIMNNNFNGMTTEEAADEIIGMIERKAGLSGLNASVVAN